MPYQVRKMDSISEMLSTRTYARNISDSIIHLLDIQIFPVAVLPCKTISLFVTPDPISNK